MSQEIGFNLKTVLLNPERLSDYKDVMYWAGVRETKYIKPQDKKIPITQIAPMLDSKKYPVPASEIKKYLSDKEVAIAEGRWKKANETALDATLLKILNKSTENKKSTYLQEAVSSFARSQITTIRRDRLEPAFAKAIFSPEDLKFVRSGAAGTRQPDIIYENESIRKTLELKLLEAITVSGGKLDPKNFAGLSIKLGGVSIQGNDVDTIYNTQIKGKKTPEIITYLQNNQKEIYKELLDKGRNIAITIPVITVGEIQAPGQKKKFGQIYKYPTTFLSFRGNNFINERYFQIFTEGPPPSIKFDVYIRDGLKTLIVEELVKIVNSGVQAAQNMTFKDIENYTKEVGRGVKFNPRNQSTLISYGEAYIIGSDKPERSIPLGGVRAVSRRKSSAFTSRTAPARRLLRETKQPSMGDFITNDTITALTQREMMRRMPIGPVGGPPLSRKVLTYRTGRFVESLKVIADMRSQAMQYYYDPRYWIHETTSRNPRDLIDSSLNSVTRNLFSKRFNLVKAERSL